MGTGSALYGRPVAKLYDADVAKREMVGVQKARQTFAARVDPPPKSEPVHTVVAKRGVPLAVIVPIEWYREAAKCLGDPTEY
jgi:hypothetical protein